MRLSRTLYIYILAVVPVVCAGAAPAAAGGASGESASMIFRDPALPEWKTEKKEFKAKVLPDGSAETVLQRGEFSSSDVKVQAEMGDLEVEETPHLVSGVARRGVKLSLGSGTGENAVRLQSFALTGARHGDPRSMVLGATGEVSLLSSIARIRTVYVSSRETLNPGARLDADGARKGDVLGVVAILEPFKEKLVAEFEADYAMFNPDTAGSGATLGDKAYRAKVGGRAGTYRYGALYERTGPQYHVMSDSEPRRDWEGVAVNFGRDFHYHALDFRLSRYNDNVDGSDQVPTIYRYEGVLDYSCKTIQALPLGVQYTRAFVSSGREPEGSAVAKTDEDTLSGRVKYLGEDWELGVRASYYQHADRIRDGRDRASTTITLAPKFTAGPFTVAPDLSLRRAMNYLERQRTSEYAARLDISGNALDKQLDYQVRGGYRRIWADDPLSRNEKVGANVRVGYPLRKVLKGFSRSLVGVRGEYNGIGSSTRRDGTYSLLVVVEGGSLL